MNKIEPTYVTYEQAVLFSKKGFDILTNNNYYDKHGELHFCQTHSEAYKLIAAGKGTDVTAPEQWQVIEWLRVKHGIYVWAAQPYKDSLDFAYKIRDNDAELTNIGAYSTPQLAISAAFDYILRTNAI